MRAGTVAHAGAVVHAVAVVLLPRVVVVVVVVLLLLPVVVVALSLSVGGCRRCLRNGEARCGDSQAVAAFAGALPVFSGLTRGMEPHATVAFAGTFRCSRAQYGDRSAARPDAPRPAQAFPLPVASEPSSGNDHYPE